MPNHRPDEGMPDRPPYETEDVGLGFVVTFALTLLVSIGVILVIVIGVYKLLTTEAEQSVATPTRYANVRQLPPPPVIQPDPKLDIDRFREQEAQKADTYGTINNQTGTMHIPVNRAMEIMLKRGFPSRPARR